MCEAQGSPCLEICFLDIFLILGSRTLKPAYSEQDPWSVQAHTAEDKRTAGLQLREQIFLKHRTEVLARDSGRGELSGARGDRPRDDQAAAALL